MAGKNPELIWTIEPPAVWPDLPNEMSVTTLLEVEACPRRWALGSATYSGMWAGRGYPPRAHLNTLAGTVVHNVLQTITRELLKCGCSSTSDAKAFGVMKGLGGYSELVNRSIDVVLKRLEPNPRAAPLLSYVAQRLRAKVPELRARVQTMMSRIKLPSVAGTSGERDETRTRRPLRFGVFSEVELRAPTIGYKGRADLLRLAPDACELMDFKTGEHDDAHVFQIRVYSLLWNRDGELNPDRRLADRLVLSYNRGDVEVRALTAEELQDLEQDLTARRGAAELAAKARPPEARPSADGCRYCGVRQLCEVYWTTETQRELATEVGNRSFTDVQLRITGRHGPRSWDAVIECFGQDPAERAALLRAADDAEFRVGSRVRILDAAIAYDADDEAQPLVFTLGSLSEVYVLR